MVAVRFAEGVRQELSVVAEDISQPCLPFADRLQRLLAACAAVLSPEKQCALCQGAGRPDRHQTAGCARSSGEAWHPEILARGACHVASGQGHRRHTGVSGQEEVHWHRRFQAALDALLLSAASLTDDLNSFG